MLDKRRSHYKNILKESPFNFDIWLDLILLEQTIADNHQTILETFRSALAMVPETLLKAGWKKYIYICLSFAAYLELESKETEKALQVLRDLTSKLETRKLCSKKTWIAGFRLMVRMGKVTEARRWFGKCLGLFPHKKIFSAYIDFESQLGNFDRCGAIFTKWLRTFPQNPDPWEAYLDYTVTLDERPRAQAIFKLAVSGKFEVSQPERIYKKWIDTLTEWGEYDQVRDAYKDLLARTGHVKVFLALAHFEFSVGDISKGRQVFENAEGVMKGKTQMKEERALLLKSWLEVEKENGNLDFAESLKRRLPKKVKKQRQVQIEADGETETLVEEYLDFMFPEELESARGLKLLQKAQQWQRNVLSMTSNPKE